MLLVLLLLLVLAAVLDRDVRLIRRVCLLILLDFVRLEELVDMSIALDAVASLTKVRAKASLTLVLTRTNSQNIHSKAATLSLLHE